MPLLNNNNSCYKHQKLTLQSTSCKLSKLKFADFSSVTHFNFKPYKLLNETISLFVEIQLLDEISSKLNQMRRVSIFIMPLQLYWKNIFTVAEYRDLIFSKLNNNSNFHIYNSLDIENTPMKVLEYFRIGLPITLQFEEDFANKTISETLHKYIKLIQYKHDETIKALLSKNKNTFVNSVFIFPEEIKHSCEQYLLYFALFLRDLGINATSNLKEEAGKVLFSVTPTDDTEALDKIREALALYLHLPSSPIVYDESFASMRMQQQIENLKHSQKMAVREIQLTEKVIMIQSETIQEKNIIISQKDSTIDQQNKVIEKITSKSVMINSLENKEELFEGLKIGESEFLKKNFGYLMCNSF